jgi:cell division protein ZapD
LNQKIIYEQPLNERIRTFLRLAHLFEQAAHHLRSTHQWDSHAAMNCLLDILSIFGRTDLKTEVLKELERNASKLNKLQSNPEIDRAQLEQILRELDALSAKLHKAGGPIAADLKQHEFLSSIKQRTAIAGGTCDFDLPGYHFWLQQPAQQRTRDLADWLGRFETIAQAIQLLLRLLRESTILKPVTAEAGFFQKTLDPNTPCQLVRVAVDSRVPYYAEISGGRHRFTVRFMELAKQNGHIKQATENIGFELGCCII